MKLISNLKLGDKVFVINKLSCTFDIAEVIEVSDAIIRFQCYFNSETLYLWRRPFTWDNNYYKIIFTDENEAIEEFKLILKHNQNGRNR